MNSSEGSFSNPLLSCIPAFENLCKFLYMLLYPDKIEVGFWWPALFICQIISYLFISMSCNSLMTWKKSNHFNLWNNSSSLLLTRVDIFFCSPSDPKPQNFKKKRNSHQIYLEFLRKIKSGVIKTPLLVPNFSCWKNITSLHHWIQ